MKVGIDIIKIKGHGCRQENTNIFPSNLTSKTQTPIQNQICKRPKQPHYAFKFTQVLRIIM